MKLLQLFSIFLLATVTALAQNELYLPAFTAYLDPADGSAKISERAGVTGWDAPAQKILWFGNIKTPGQLRCVVEMYLPADAKSKLRLTVAGKSSDAQVSGADGRLIKADFGTFEIPAGGYQKFTLESLNVAGQPAGDIEALRLDGAAAQDAHFNLKSGRGRAAASVHLNYPDSGLTNINAFYCEVTATETPVGTYFEACGWHRGYFGMQVNSSTERRIIFSVWDSGHEEVERSKVAAEDRVTLVAKGAGVFSGDFGHEGTGGHSHLVYDWKTNEKQRFLVTAKPTDATHTIYSGYWFHPDQKKWVLISSWKAPKDGKYLHGLYSFVEDFDGDNGQLHRQALYGNQWLGTADGKWHEVTSANFSHDPTGKANRLDRFMGVEDGRFFLSTGGFLSGFTRYGQTFIRPATGKMPVDFTPPELLESGQP